MARPAPQSFQRYPLTTILGTEANVRLLRELCRHGGQLSAPLLVARTGLGKTAVWAALSALEEVGVVEMAGTGRARLHRARADHPLFPSLEALFSAEDARFAAICEAVRLGAKGDGSRALAVWIYGSVARGDDHRGSDLDVAVVAKPTELARIVNRMREALREPGEKLAFVPSVVGIDTDDVARLSKAQDPWWARVVEDAIVVLGKRPEELAVEADGSEAVA